MCVNINTENDFYAEKAEISEHTARHCGVEYESFECGKGDTGVNGSSAQQDISSVV